MQMGFLRKLWDWIKSTPRKEHKKWHPDLNPIDIKKISAALNLKAEAHRLGAAGVPRESDQQLSGPETAIVHKVEEARQDYMTWGELRLATLNQELSRKDITQQINQARKADQEFERMASAELTANYATLRELGEIASSRKEELNRFKIENAIDRLPIVPMGNAKVLIVILAIVLIAVEAFLNMTFFAQGLNSGLVGGFFQAFVAATVNVGVSFILGAYLIRYINHIKLLPKFLGFVVLALTACFILMMAFGIAHYRDALVMGADNAMSLALQTLLTAPVGLTELSSWLLFMVSVGFGVIAVFDGYKMDDPYPGYGKKFLLTDEAIKDYNAEIDALHAYLEDSKKESLDHIEHVALHSETSVSIYKNLLGEKERSGNDLTNAVAGAENAMQALLQEFRDENKIARGDMPTPTYFDTWPQLRELKMPNFSTSTDQENLANQSQLLAEFLNEVQDIRARIQTAFNTRFSALHTVDTNFTPSSGKNFIFEPEVASVGDSECQPKITPIKGVI